ncbi:MAG TPA: hypothetical protein VFN41_14535 [Candidatus Limnocylindrales bacterium]|nr:hypothetical protein [Candidatus Limnocylindrales bacterium]
MRNLFIGLLVVAALVVGGGIIAQTAYQAGLSTAVTTAVASAPAGTVVTPVAPVPYPYYYGGWGWGWGHGFPFLGFIGFFLFLFLIFGLMRAVFWRGRGGWGRGWGGPGYGYGPGGYGPGGYDKGSGRDPRSHFQQTFDDWHRQAHGEGSSSEPTSPTPPRSPDPGA